MFTITTHFMQKCTSGTLHDASIRFEQRYSKKLDICLSAILLLGVILAYWHVGGMYDYRALLICGTFFQTLALSLYKCWNPCGSFIAKEVRAKLYHQ